MNSNWYSNVQCSSCSETIDVQYYIIPHARCFPPEHCDATQFRKKRSTPVYSGRKLTLTVLHFFPRRTYRRRTYGSVYILYIRITTVRIRYRTYTYIYYVDEGTIAVLRTGRVYNISRVRIWECANTAVYSSRLPRPEKTSSRSFFRPLLRPQGSENMCPIKGYSLRG